MSQSISVQLDVVAELVVELRALGAELVQEEQLTSAAGWSLERVLAGPVGAEATVAGGEWAAALAAVVEGTLAVATTLDSALAGYRAVEAELAVQLGGGPWPRSEMRAVPQ